MTHFVSEMVMRWISVFAKRVEPDFCIGKREKGNFGVGSKLGEQRLRGWADDVLKHLDSGMTPANAKAWISERLAAA